MGDEAGGGKAPAGPDTRLPWLCDRICSSLRVKDDAWQRVLASEAQ